MMALDNINLDCAASPDELRIMATAFDTLALYARLKARAMECRADGNIRVASEHETRLEALYATLPTDWKW